MVRESVSMVPGNILEVSFVMWSYGRTEGMSGLAMFAFIAVLFNLVTV